MQNIIFFGSDQYSFSVLEKLLDSDNLLVSTVVTTSPRHVGRNQLLTSNIVEKTADRHKLKVLHYPDNHDDLNNFISLLPHDPSIVGLSASFPRIMPPSLVSHFAGNLYNIHPSLLPQYRNVAPGPYAIAMGDKVTGVSIFEIGTGIDNGQIVAQTDLPILPTDTTPILLKKLFALGTELFIKFLADPHNPELTKNIPIMRSADLIFTRKLNREVGYIEPNLLSQLISNKPIRVNDTDNLLIKLRLTHHPDRNHNILPDLVRALDGYEKVWTKVETAKGKLEISLSFDTESSQYGVLIAGKPKPISWTEFSKYYIK